MLLPKNLINQYILKPIPIPKQKLIAQFFAEYLEFVQLILEHSPPNSVAPPHCSSLLFAHSSANFAHFLFRLLLYLSCREFVHIFPHPQSAYVHSPSVSTSKCLILAYFISSKICFKLWRIGFPIAVAIILLLPIPFNYTAFGLKAEIFFFDSQNKTFTFIAPVCFEIWFLNLINLFITFYSLIDLNSLLK